MLKINQNRQSDVTAFVNMAAALPAGNLLYLVLSLPKLIIAFCVENVVYYFFNKANTFYSTTL
jgi:hypothetical protein